MTRSRAFALVSSWLISSCLVATLGCNRLTTPPEPEPMATETLTAAAAAPAPQAPSAKPPSPLPTPAPSASASAELPGIVEVLAGKGDVAKAGDKVRVHYTGTLTDGKEFDSSRKREPIEFVLGQGRVIRGWDLGVAGMKVGGKRKLTIQPGLGYGPRGKPPVIPPNSTLLFDVELVEIVK
jgi:hypothetical protein